MTVVQGFRNLDAMPEEQLSDMMALRLVVANRGEVKFWRLKAGLRPEAHSHPEEQITWFLKGRVEFRIGEETRLCGPGDIALIPGGVEHQGAFLEDTEMVSIFMAPPAAGRP